MKRARHGWPPNSHRFKADRQAREIGTAVAAAEISDDAKCLLGGWFGLGLTEVTFAMLAGRPTPRCQAAIDELVAAQLIKRSPHPPRGFVLRPLVDCSAYKAWLTKNRSKGDWPVTEDIVPPTKRDQ